MTNGYSKEDLIIVNIPTADQVSVLVSSASLMVDQQETMRKPSISEGGSGRKISTSSMKVSFDREISIQEEDDPKADTSQQQTTSSSTVDISNGNSS